MCVHMFNLELSLPLEVVDKCDVDAECLMEEHVLMVSLENGITGKQRF